MQYFSFLDIGLCNQDMKLRSLFRSAGGTYSSSEYLAAAYGQIILVKSGVAAKVPVFTFDLMWQSDQAAVAQWQKVKAEATLKRPNQMSRYCGQSANWQIRLSRADEPSHERVHKFQFVSANRLTLLHHCTHLQ